MYVNGLRFESGSAAVEVSIDGKITKLAVVRNGKGRSRLDRWGPGGREDGCVGEINLRDLAEILAREGLSEIKAIVSLKHVDAEVMLDPSKAMGREGREIPTEQLRDALAKVPPHVAREIAIAQLHTLPYGKENHESATRRLQLMLPFLADGDIRQAVLEGAENVLDHAMPRVVGEIGYFSPKDAQWLTDRRTELAALSSTGVFGAAEADIALCIKAASGSATTDEARRAVQSEFATEAQVLDIITAYNMTDAIGPHLSERSLMTLIDSKHEQCAIADWDGYALPALEDFQTYLKAAVALVTKDPGNLGLLLNGTPNRSGLFAYSHPAAVAASISRSTRWLGDKSAAFGYPDFYQEVFDTAASSGYPGVVALRTLMSDVDKEFSYERGMLGGNNYFALRASVAAYSKALASCSGKISESQALDVLSRDSIPEIEAVSMVSAVSDLSELERLSEDDRPSVQLAALLRMDSLGVPRVQRASELINSGVINPAKTLPSLICETISRSGDNQAAISYIKSLKWLDWDSGTCIGADYLGVELASAVSETIPVLEEDAPIRKVVQMALSTASDMDDLVKAASKKNKGSKNYDNLVGFGDRMVLTLLEERAAVSGDWRDVRDLQEFIKDEFSHLDTVLRSGSAERIVSRLDSKGLRRVLSLEDKDEGSAKIDTSLVEAARKALS